MDLTWKASFSGGECRIFRGKLIIGLLKTSLWTNEGYGELNGHMLKFRTKGFGSRVTRLFDIEGTRELGQIQFNLWNGSAIITYEGVSYKWKFDSWMRKKWSVKSADNSAEFIRTSFWNNEGSIDNEDVSAGVILAALFVHHYFWNIAAATS